MPIDLTAAVLIYLAPFAIATTAGLWLVLLGGLGLPVFLERLPVFTNVSNKIIRPTVLVISWGGAVMLLIDFYLWLFGHFSVILLAWSPFLCLAPDYSRTATVFRDWWMVVPLMWTILAAEGPLVPFVHFGLPAVLKLLDIAEDHRERITTHVTGAMLFAGILTVLLCSGWPVWTAFANPESLWEHSRLGLRLSPLLLSLCPVNLVLAIGLSVRLAVAGDRRVETTAGAVVAAAIVAAVTIAGAIGVVLSVLYIRSI